MAMTIWRPGRRLFTVAAVLMLLTAAAHTAGNVVEPPVDPAEQRVFAAMESHRIDMGMGMNPSVRDIFKSLTFTMSITMGALGLLNLLLAGSAAMPAGVLRSVSWVNLIWVGAFLVLNWVCRIPPPLICAVLIELAVVGALLTLKSGPSQALS